MTVDEARMVLDTAMMQSIHRVGLAIVVMERYHCERFAEWERRIEAQARAVEHAIAVMEGRE
jgi:hypothetical protein